jgi:hypothetical protein
MIYYTGVYNRQDTKGQKIKAGRKNIFTRIPRMDMNWGRRNIQHPTSNIQHPTSNAQSLKPKAQHRTPNNGLGQLLGHRKVFNREIYEIRERGWEIQPQESAENIEKKDFKEKRGLDREDLVLFFAPFAFFCG